MEVLCGMLKGGKIKAFFKKLISAYCIEQQHQHYWFGKISKVAACRDLFLQKPYRGYRSSMERQVLLQNLCTCSHEGVTRFAFSSITFIKVNLKLFRLLLIRHQLFNQMKVGLPISFYTMDKHFIAAAAAAGQDHLLTKNLIFWPAKVHFSRRTGPPFMSMKNELQGENGNFYSRNKKPIKRDQTYEGILQKTSNDKSEGFERQENGQFLTIELRNVLPCFSANGLLCFIF